MLKLKNLNRIAKPWDQRVKKYTELLYSNFGKNLVGLLLFGSVARGKQKSSTKYESDADILSVIENLPERFSLKRLDLSIKVGHIYRIESEWVTKFELEQYFQAKTGFILDAFDEGIIVYDPENYLIRKREELFQDLKKKGVIKKPSLGWVFPIKIGEKIEY